MTSRLSLVKYIKSYNLTELASIYEESPRTVKGWIKKHKDVIGERHGQKYTPKQVELIFEKVGVPQKILDALEE